MPVDDLVRFHHGIAMPSILPLKWQQINTTAPIKIQRNTQFLMSAKREQRRLNFFLISVSGVLNRQLGKLTFSTWRFLLFFQIYIWNCRGLLAAWLSPPKFERSRLNHLFPGAFSLSIPHPHLLSHLPSRHGRRRYLRLGVGCIILYLSPPSPLPAPPMEHLFGADSSDRFNPPGPTFSEPTRLWSTLGYASGWPCRRSGGHFVTNRWERSGPRWSSCLGAIHAASPRTPLRHHCHCVCGDKAVPENLAASAYCRN